MVSAIRLDRQEQGLSGMQSIIPDMDVDLQAFGGALRPIQVTSRIAAKLSLPLAVVEGEPADVSRRMDDTKNDRLIFGDPEVDVVTAED